MPIKAVSRAATHVGMVRELNEDSYLEKGAVGLWAVADGMGGHAAGEAASQAVVKGLAGMKKARNFKASVKEIKRLLGAVNSQLIYSSGDFPPGMAPGATVAVLLIEGEQAAVLWAGDSRVYRKRRGRIEQLTRDHSHVQELLDCGLIGPEEAAQHPMTNVITRAIGIEDLVKIDSRIFKVCERDQFLLCTDGLNRLVKSTEIAELLDSPDDGKIVQSLLHTALERGAPDNVTLIYVGC